MAIQSLEVTVIAAEGLKDLKHVNTMDPFATISLCGRDEQRTPVHWNGGTTPRWVYSVAFPLDEAKARAGHLFLVYNIKTKKALRKDRDIASGEVSVKELLEKQGDGNPEAMSHKVRLQPKGELEFRYYFSEALLAPRAADQERGKRKRIGGRGLMRMLLCAGQIASTIVVAAVE